MKYLVVLLLLLSSGAFAVEPTTYKYGNFGQILVYQPTKAVKNVILFLSGDAGWKLGVIEMAQAFVADGNIVVGVNSNTYFKAVGKSKLKCFSAAGDLELLSKFVQAKLKRKTYQLPILVGFSSGATLVYAALVQAPNDTFAGGISLGFCTDLEEKKPLCKGYGLKSKALAKGWEFEPSPRELNPWVVLNGEEDKVCPIEPAKKFVAQVKDAVMISLPKVGHGFGAQENWLPQLQKALEDNFDDPSGDVAEKLPLIENPVDIKKSDYFVVFYSGDGGWAGFDQDVVAQFVKSGVPVIGLNSLKYFWSKREPKEATKDLKEIIATYQKKWGLQKFALMGYSFGADVLPFLANRLDVDTKKNLKRVGLLGLSEQAAFEFHFENWVSDDVDDGYPVIPELDKLAPIRVQCLYGEEEKDSACATIKNKKIEVIRMPGGHHFNGDIDGVFKKLSE
jgi:type IV secretory pathway VirJ component